MATLAYGVRMLQAKIGEVLRAVARGDHVLVTSRGRAVALILPPGEAIDRRGSIQERLHALAASGKLRLGKSGTIPPYDLPPLDGLSRQVLADRR